MNDADVADRIMDAQAELQAALGFHRLDYMRNPRHIEMRLAACLAMLHSLLGDLGRPMYNPAQMPNDWTGA